jgi:selenocysteine lyase/cysteine desulfurase
MLQEAHNFDNHNWKIADSARRFECGSPNMTGIHALHASLSLIDEVGMPEIERLVDENSQFIIDFFMQRQSQYQLLTPTAAHQRAGIITFLPLAETSESLFAQLSQQHVACALRGGGIRFSPHFYTPRKKLFTALEILDG